MIGSYMSIGYRPAQDGQPMVPGGDLPDADPQESHQANQDLPAGRSADLDNQHGNWFLANQQMLAAFKYANADC